MDVFEAPPALRLDRRPRMIDAAILRDVTAALARNAAHHDRTGAFPHENLQLLHQHGLTGLAALRELDGNPLTLAEARAVVDAVAAGDASTALVLVMTYLFVVQAAGNPFWPAALRRDFLQDVAVNGALANALRVEPALGTPIRGGLPETLATRVPGGWRITGRKLYSTGMPGLSWLGVWGRTDDAEPLIGTFLVPAGAAGVSMEETWDQLGMRATGSHDAVLKDVFIPADYAVDIRSAEGWTAARPAAQLAWMSVLLGTLYHAVARNARDWLVRFAHERAPSNLGAPLATLPRYQAAMGEIDALLFTNTALLDRATNAADAPGVESHFTKLIVTENAIAVTQKIIALAGNPALSRANPAERHARDALCGRVHSPQADTILTDAGKAALAAYSRE